MNSRTKGHGYERAMAERLREIWPDCYSQRFKGSLWLDHCGIDLVNTEPFNFQLKAMERVPPYHTILKSMPKGKNMNVVLHKRNNAGTVVVLCLEDFLNIVNKLKNENRNTN